MTQFYHLIKIKVWNAKEPEFRPAEHDIEAWLRGKQGGRLLPPRRIEYHDITESDIKEHGSKEKATIALIQELHKECLMLSSVKAWKRWTIRKTVGQVATFVEVPTEYKNFFGESHEEEAQAQA